MKLVIVCEHLFRTPELPCFQVLNDPIGDTDAGIAYHCMKCVEEIATTEKGLESVSEKSKCICDTHCDPMTIVATHDLRSPAR